MGAAVNVPTFVDRFAEDLPHAWVVRAGSQGEAEASNLDLGRASRCGRSWTVFTRMRRPRAGPTPPDNCGCSGIPSRSEIWSSCRSSPGPDRSLSAASQGLMDSMPQPPNSRGTTGPSTGSPTRLPGPSCCRTCWPSSTVRRRSSAPTETMPPLVWNAWPRVASMPGTTGMALRSLCGAGCCTANSLRCWQSTASPCADSKRTSGWQNASLTSSPTTSSPPSATRMTRPGGGTTSAGGPPTWSPRGG